MFNKYLLNLLPENSITSRFRISTRYARLRVPIFIYNRSIIIAVVELSVVNHHIIQSQQHVFPGGTLNDPETLNPQLVS